MQLGVMSFGDLRLDRESGTRVPVAQGLKEQLERIQLAEQVGLDFYGLGEHHLDGYAISNPGTVLAAASSLTERITLGTAVTVLSTEDPVRLFQQFTTLDQLSEGRAEIMAGRGSFTESYPLFGASLNDYEALYDEKIQLLLQLNQESPITWKGRFRSDLNNALVLPRPYGAHLRVSIGTGGNPQSSVRAGALGAPVVYAIIGGEPERFAPLVDLYRRASVQSGHPESSQHVTMTAIGLIAERSQDAKNSFYPFWKQAMEWGAVSRGWSVPSRADYDRMVDGAAMIFAGSPDEIAQRLISVGQLTGADRYVMQMDWAGLPHSDVMTAIELLGTRVKPQVDAAFG
ncbi:LLM class flavin-dependent oxidoreductase [Demequina aurantiaca]|uniref:LLM class flavin-dependent oxidoreductase n=1 Tax=Demequina aurantiaca TaxID=676200 RepID=UPI0007815655|nr:LLM class flavin-dependent oxidoreductase [Demequina aurantiaca]